MPQITLEYTPATLDSECLPEVMQQVHQVLADAGVAIANCKSRWWMNTDYLIGTGEPEQGFVHLTLRLLEGRAPALLEKIGRACLALLEDQVSTAPGVQLTVAIDELRRDTYFKA